MTPYKSLKLGLKLGFEFWLPLALLGLAFWVGGGYIMDKILSQASHGDSRLKVEAPQSVKQRPKLIIFIKAEIYKNSGVSKVEVKTVSNALKELRFEFPVTENSLVEDAIAKELGLPREEIRSLTHYQIKFK